MCRLLWFICFIFMFVSFVVECCHAMLCISTAYAIMRYRSVRPSLCLSVTFVYFVKNDKDIFTIFSLLDTYIILVFHTKCYGSTPMGNFLMGCKCRGKHKSRFSNSGFIACCQRCDRQVLYTQVRQTVTSWWHSLSFVYRGRRTTKCLWQEALTLGRRQQNNILIVRSGKSEAEITTNKRLRSGNCTVEAD